MQILSGANVSAVLSRAHIQIILKRSIPFAGAALWMNWDLVKGGFVAHCLLVVAPSSSYLPSGLVCASSLDAAVRV